MRLKRCNPYFTKPTLSGNPFFQPPYALALLLCAWRLFHRFGVECDSCMYYAPHANHSVIYYYDATALGSNYAVNDQDIHWVVVHEFERHGWSVQDVYLGNPMRHDEKYLLINQGFSGKQRLMPYFNRQNNDDLILAVQSAGVERGRNGFRKNKSTEKNPESEEDLLEHRTDGTDVFDTLYIGCEKFPQHDFYGGLWEV